MEDAQIIDLYLKRSESAISETDNKYRNYLHTIAYNILANNEDTEECINDTYMKTWTSIPPTIPNILSCYLGKIIKNLALSVYTKKKRAKRGKGEINLILDELSECIASDKNVESEIENKQLLKQINDFLGELQYEYRIIFIRRYWYAESIEAIAEKYSMTQSKVKSILFRLRNKLRQIIE